MAAAAMAPGQVGKAAVAEAVPIRAARRDLPGIPGLRTRLVPDQVTAAAIGAGASPAGPGNGVGTNSARGWDTASPGGGGRSGSNPGGASGPAGREAVGAGGRAAGKLAPLVLAVTGIRGSRRMIHVHRWLERLQCHPMATALRHSSRRIWI